MINTLFSFPQMKCWKKSQGWKKKILKLSKNQSKLIYVKNHTVCSKKLLGIGMRSKADVSFSISVKLKLA